MFSTYRSNDKCEYNFGDLNNFTYDTDYKFPTYRYVILIITYI